MKHGVTDQELARRTAFAQGTLFARAPPSIPYKQEESKLDENTTVIEYVIPTEGTSTNKIKREMPVFIDGSSEDVAKWLEKMDYFFKDAKVTTASIKEQYYITCLANSALVKFQEVNAVEKRKNAARPTRSRLSEDDLLKQVINEWKIHYFPGGKHAYRNQANYMRHGIVMGESDSIKSFASRLRSMNNYLSYFPTTGDGSAPTPLSEDELIDILDRAKPIAWHMAMLAARVDTFDMKWDDIIDYYQRLELRSDLENLQQSNQKKNLKKKRARGSPETQSSETSEDHSRKTRKKTHLCPHCKKWGTHSPEECRQNPKNVEKEKSAKSDYFKKRSKEETSALANAVVKQMIKPLKLAATKAKKKRKICGGAEEEEKAYLAAMKASTQLDSDTEYNYSTDEAEFEDETQKDE